MVAFVVFGIVAFVGVPFIASAACYSSTQVLVCTGSEWIYPTYGSPYTVCTQTQYVTRTYEVSCPTPSYYHYEPSYGRYERHDRHDYGRSYNRNYSQYERHYDYRPYRR